MKILKRRSARKKVYDYPFNFRMSRQMYALLQTVALFEHLEVSDLLRMILHRELKGYRKDRLFAGWTRRQRVLLAQEGVDLSSLFESERQTAK